MLIIIYINKLRNKVNNYIFEYKDIYFNKYFNFKIINYVNLSCDFNENIYII